MLGLEGNMRVVEKGAEKVFFEDGSTEKEGREEDRTGGIWDYEATECG